MPAHLDRRQRAAAHERKLGVDGLEVGITKLTPDIGHNLTYLSPAAVKEISKARAARCQIRQPRLRVGTDMALRDGGEFRFADGREAALRHHVADGLLQNIVDKCAEDRRIEACLLPGFGF